MCSHQLSSLPCLQAYPSTFTTAITTSIHTRRLTIVFLWHVFAKVVEHLTYTYSRGLHVSIITDDTKTHNS